MPEHPSFTFRDEAIHALDRARLHTMADAPTETVTDGLIGIGWAILHAAEPDQTVRLMIEHSAEHDCALVLRLIDADVFAVSCDQHPEFRHEWRTR